MAQTDLQFTCRGCAERIPMNPPMRDALLDAGCPVCRDPVSPTDFTRN